MGGIISSTRKQAGNTKKLPFHHGEPDHVKLPAGTDILSDNTTISLACTMDRTSSCFLIVVPIAEKEEEKEKEKEKQVEDQEKEDKEEQNKNVTPAKVRWTFYNDSKKYHVRVTVTFLRASQGIQTLDPSAETVHTDTGSLRVSAVLHAGETLPFVEGCVGVYLLKCEKLEE
ncbi:protein of unknown function DUF1935 [Trypanosoma melophagium]|uniref:protein of unknown function DUF1935 n=1 Tax=Trypanosoma melophagium TaxID=715481 RepID=UPI00351A6E9B|nr:protein of unknown function DUF1935 [Trypanosoma melophagium]